MDYIISEEELKRLVSICNHDFKYESISMDSDIKDFLQSKQPVELMAEGEVKVSYKDDMEVSVGDTLLKDTLSKYQNKGQNIKIYIQKVKE